jgi:electron-transferring-flavoprotein dehydrogenase
MDENQTLPLDCDIACVGFGPAMGGFLTTLSKGLDGLDSRAMPGLPPQVLCYERADDLSFGVSGVVTRGRAIRDSLPEFNPADVPMAAAVTDERVLYLLDPHGASRRPWLMRAADQVLQIAAEKHALELPWVPGFLHKKDGFLASLGQFNQWVAGQLMMTGLVQLWPATPVEAPILEDGRVAGVRLMGGTEVRAALTVVGDGPVGAVGRALDETFGLPEGHQRDEWAVGMKIVVDLPDSCTLPAGTVFHTIGYPEPEIFGFFYVHPDRVASAGIFVPSWFRSPLRTAYRYLQHFLLHPAIWQHVQGGRMRSWGAKSLNENGRRGEPRLTGEGFARIGEGSGSTNVLTGSGVDEAWLTGTVLAEAVLELLREGKPFTRQNLDASYVARRRASWLEKELKIAEHARDGFRRGILSGFFGMGLAGLTGGLLSVPAPAKEPKQPPTPENLEKAFEESGWPPIPYDGQLLVSHQDALLIGGKVQAPTALEDHVRFKDHSVCEACVAQLCVAMCSGQALRHGDDGLPVFDREKCVHCGACLWNCESANVIFAAGPGGLHSAEN